MCLSAPIDEDEMRQRERSKLIDMQLLHDSHRFRNTIRVLLLGSGESGKSTFLKQMKVLHKDGFSDEETRNAIAIIHDNVHESIYALTFNLRKLKIPLNQRMAVSSMNYILAMGVTRPQVIPHEYPKHVKLLWLDEGIKEVYKMRNTFQLLDCTRYFLDKIDALYGKSYVPNTDDMLHARTITKGVHEMNFSVRKGNHSYDILMIDVGGQRTEQAKWVQAFDGVKVVLFLSACSEFDQQLRENESVNRLKESLHVFQMVWRNRCLRNAGIILFLNKVDLLEEKLRNGKRIGNSFDDFNEFCSKNGCKLPSGKKDPHTIETTKEFIKYKFRNVAIPFTLRGFIKDEEILVQRECTLHFTTATNTGNIKKVFADCQHIILIQNLKKWEFA